MLVLDYCQKDGLAGLPAGFWLLEVLCNFETCVCPEFGHALVTCSHGFTCQANLIEFDEESDTCACPLLGAFGRFWALREVLSHYETDRSRNWRRECEHSKDYEVSDPRFGM